MTRHLSDQKESEVKVHGNQTHGQSRTRLYNTWRSMKKRCYTSKAKDYPRYGGRGIYICNLWMNNPKAFFAWAKSSGYQDNLTIERINNEGPYSPENCKWIAAKQQARNRRSNVFLEIEGKSKTLAEWATHAGISRSGLHHRYRRGLRDVKLLTPPRGLFTTVDGITRSLKDWAQLSGIKYMTLYRRYRKGLRELDLFKPTGTS